MCHSFFSPWVMATPRKAAKGQTAGSPASYGLLAVEQTINSKSLTGDTLWHCLAQASLMLSAMLLVWNADNAGLIAARTVELAQIKLNDIMLTVNAWMKDHTL